MATIEHHGHPAVEGDNVATLLSEQFDDLGQQHDTSMLGMWGFLATEVLFFGGLIGAYAVYRSTSPVAFAVASGHMNVILGCVNTMVLLCSSLTMAIAVRSSQLGHRKHIVQFLMATWVLGAVFLGVKMYEWYVDYEENLAPGINYVLHPEDAKKIDEAHGVKNPGLEKQRVQMFFVLYFCMTGLHAIHMIVGLAVVGTMIVLTQRKWFSGYGEIPIEVTGLYWHFVDIVWVFLYPLLYLIDVRGHH